MFNKGIDLAFIDGKHLAEFALRDFINTEKYMNSGGVIVIDDVFPEQGIMMVRERRSSVWSGDVYKVIRILKKYRPELEVEIYNAFVGPFRKGLAVIKGFDPSNTVLADNYDVIEKDILTGLYDVDNPEKLIAEFGPKDPKQLRRFL